MGGGAAPAGLKTAVSADQALTAREAEEARLAEELRADFELRNRLPSEDLDARSGAATPRTPAGSSRPVGISSSSLIESAQKKKKKPVEAPKAKKVREDCF